ncbi:MAG: DUF4342 domain-containing protein [Clostridia bacterium]|nr:DUF4342 domain-containing protein [Clostridia bacterium]
MDISLEKIELVKDRTGVSYKEAKEALEHAKGNVVDAIIYIEENIDGKNKFKFMEENEIVEKLKEFVKKGNVSKIVFKKDDEVILNIPVNAGIIGMALAPWPAIGGTIAAMMTKCKIEIIKEDGEVVDFSEIANDKFDDIKNKADDVFDEVKNMTEDAIQNVKTKVDEYKDSKSKDDEDEEDEE